MISYETWCRIRDCRDRQGMTLSQIATKLQLHPRTVAAWAGLLHYEARKNVKRASVLDPFKGQVTRLQGTHPFSAQQIFQRLREAGYAGSYTTVKDYVHLIRPKHRPAFLKLVFAPGEAAQVDWGEFGTIAVGGTRRKLSFFVMVLCHSRRMVLAFMVSQTMEHFLAAHEHAFAAWGAVPQRIIIDNLKTGVIEHALNPAAQLWIESVANVRIHSETRQRPIDLFEQEKGHLQPPNPAAYDIGRISLARVSKLFRVTFETNHYSTPVHYVGARVTVKTYPDRLCIYHAEQLIARHARCYGRHQDIEDPDHPKPLIAQRKNANEQRLLLRFLTLTPKAADYHAGLAARRLNWRNHVAKINALAEIYGDAATGRAIEDGLAFDAFSCEYITNLLEARARALPEASPLQLTRRSDLLELELAAPDLSLYEGCHHERKNRQK